MPSRKPGADRLAAAPASSGPVARVLIAEDERPVREFVARALQVAGHRVCAVEDGAAALETLRAGRFDLLLTDLRMPGVDGIALARQALQENPGLRIVMMTGYSRELQREPDVEALADRIVFKPFTLAEIRSAVSEVLSRVP